MKKKIIYFFLYCFLIIFILESILAVKNRSQIDFKKERSVILSEHIPLINMTILPDNFEMDNTDTLARKKYRLRTDEQGYIMPSKIHNNPDLTIVFIGGSTTECLFVEEDNRFPYLVGRTLEKETGKKINSYNAGVSGNNSRDSLNILLNKLIFLKPDIVVMLHNINDLNLLLYKGAFWNEDYLVENNFYMLCKKIISAFTPNLYMHLRYKIATLILPEFSDRASRRETKKAAIDKNKLNKKFRLNLQTFINICRARRITPVLMTQGNRLKDNPDKAIKDALQEFKINLGFKYGEYKGLLELFNETIRRVGRDSGTLIIDLAKEIPQEKEYLVDAVHFNDNGSRLAAQIISREMKKLFSNENRDWVLLNEKHKR